MNGWLVKFYQLSLKQGDISCGEHQGVGFGSLTERYKNPSLLIPPCVKGVILVWDNIKIEKACPRYMNMPPIASKPKLNQFMLTHLLCELDVSVLSLNCLMIQNRLINIHVIVNLWLLTLLWADLCWTDFSLYWHLRLSNFCCDWDGHISDRPPTFWNEEGIGKF